MTFENIGGGGGGNEEIACDKQVIACDKQVTSNFFCQNVFNFNKIIIQFNPLRHIYAF